MNSFIMTTDELNHFFIELKEPMKRYNEYCKMRLETGFNVFYLISDYYYRETFHNDIIAALLSPEEKHGNGKMYLNLFVEMINKMKPLEMKPLEMKPLVDIRHYQTPKVNKEKYTNDGELSGRIDILIEGELIEGKKHCIVIENKLNNAPDTDQQLPKYYRDLIKRDIIIDAFVYMPLNPQKAPDSSSWKDEERKFINERLVIVPAYSAGQINLVENWLSPAERVTSNEDAKFIIKQYKTLLNNLTLDIMDDREILDVLLKADNIETTINILSLQESIVRRIIKEFIDKLRLRLSEYEFQLQECNYRIGITNKKYPSWRFVIERVGTKSGWYRGLQYDGPRIQTNKYSKWEKEQHDFPLGWDYFEDNHRYWDESIITWKSMLDGTFADEIISEVQDAFLEIEKQKLPE